MISVLVEHNVPILACHVQMRDVFRLSAGSNLLNCMMSLLGIPLLNVATT